MEILGYVALFIGSLAVLVKASDWFVEAAEEIGLSFGISPFIIGVTIVAFGTSLPELASSVAAVLAGSSEIVVGNVIGSNITNICIVLGLIGVVSKTVKMEYRVMDIDVPILLASAFLLWFILRDQVVLWWEAVLFLVCLVVFLINSLGGGEEEKDENEHKATYKTYGLLLLGGILVWLSATYVVVAIDALSTAAGIPSEIIAITFVAIGTSLPEIVVSITAARKGNAGMAVGNVLGSNIFNTFAVMGIPALIDDIKIPDSIMDFSLPFMVAVTLMFTVSCVSNRFSRWEGMIFIIVYVYFMAELVQNTLSTI